MKIKANSVTRISFASLFISIVVLTGNVYAQTLNLMPVPASLEINQNKLTIDPSFTVAIKYNGDNGDKRLSAAVERLLLRMESRTGLTFTRQLSSDLSKASLVIESTSAGNQLPSINDDESYSLIVNNNQALLKSAQTVGSLRGIETFFQLLSGDARDYVITGVKIDDKPRFKWRGLMLDISRHWMPMNVVKRNIDGIATVKMNVLHLHITDDQGFRIESKKFPKLQQLGSDGNYYTQDQMREIIEYARIRGIRVVPEFDLPGHATTWLVAFPELGSKPGTTYQIERKWGIFDPTLDPSNENVYKLLDGFLGEMTALFPDDYVHIGGDENEGKDWTANSKIQAFIKEKGLKDNHGLQAYFNRRVLEILKKNKKKMIGWDEIMHPDIPKDAVIQSWRGFESLAESAQKGYHGLLSNGYYIDLMHPTHEHYLNDPLPANNNLSSDHQQFIMGGEATMWSEWVSVDTIDSRIWPRTAAIAERLWSPQNIKDVGDMYRRLAVINGLLEEYNLLNEKNYGVMIRRLAGNLGNDEKVFNALKSFIDILEPVKRYERGKMLPNENQLSPRTRLVDAARADSAKAREFTSLVENRKFDQVRNQLIQWKEAAEIIKTQIIPQSAILAEALPLVEDLEKASSIGLEALNKNGVDIKPLDEFAKPKVGVQLMVVDPIRKLALMLLTIKRD